MIIFQIENPTNVKNSPGAEARNHVSLAQATASDRERDERLGGSKGKESNGSIKEKEESKEDGEDTKNAGPTFRS